MASLTHYSVASPAVEMAGFCPLEIAAKRAVSVTAVRARHHYILQDQTFRFHCRIWVQTPPSSHLLRVSAILPVTWRLTARRIFEAA
jgi:hypothetical protein